MSRDGQPTLRVNLIDRLLDIETRRDRAREKEAEHVALSCRDLLADDNVTPSRAGVGRCLDRPVDAVVIGDGDHREPQLDRARDDRRGRWRSVAERRVYVQIRGAGRRCGHHRVNLALEAGGQEAWLAAATQSPEMTGTGSRSSGTATTTVAGAELMSSGQL